MVPAICASFSKRQRRGLGIDIDHHIAHFLIGAQVLARDIDAVVGKHLVDGRENAGTVLMHMQDAVVAGVLGQCHFGKLTAEVVSTTVVAVLDRTP